MLRFTTLTAILLLAGVVEAREFTTRSGYTFEAEIVSISQSHVKFQGPDGEEVDFPRRLLSDGDRRLVRRTWNELQRRKTQEYRARLLRERKTERRRVLRSQVARDKAVERRVEGWREQQRQRYRDTMERVRRKNQPTFMGWQTYGGVTRPILIPPK